MGVWGHNGRAKIIIKHGQKKNCNTSIGIYIKKLQANNKKFKKIGQFIWVYIINSEGFTKKIAKKLGQNPGLPDLETTHVGAGAHYVINISWELYVCLISWTDKFNFFES